MELAFVEHGVSHPMGMSPRCPENRRVRGRDLDAESTSLLSGTRENATVLFLDLKGSTEYARGRDPQEVFLTINQMMAAMTKVLRRHGLHVSVFRGDGFLALSRGAGHAVRAVEAGLDLFAAMAEFNEPRVVLGLQPFEARVGISTGEMFQGNVGTYDKMKHGTWDDGKPGG